MKPPTARPSALLLIPAGAGLLLVAVPVIGLLQRAPWSSLLDRLTSDTVLDAIQVSVTVSVAAAIIATVLGLPLAWLLARHVRLKLGHFLNPKSAHCITRLLCAGTVVATTLN